MTCPICDQKPMNCDCTPRERAMYMELQELEDRPVVVLTDAEREAIEWCRDNITAMACPSSAFAYIHASSLRGLLARCAIGHQ